MKRALEGLPGVASTRVNLGTERATVDYDSRALTVARMIEAVRGTTVLPAVRRAIQRIPRARRGRQSR